VSLCTLINSYFVRVPNLPWGRLLKPKINFPAFFFLIEPYRYIEGVQKKPQILMAQKAVKFFVRIFSHSYGNENQWFCVVFN